MSSKQLTPSSSSAPLATTATIERNLVDQHCPPGMKHRPTATTSTHSTVPAAESSSTANSGTGINLSLASNIARHFNTTLVTFNGLFHRNFQDDIYPSSCNGTEQIDRDLGHTTPMHQRNSAFLGRPKVRRGSANGDTKELDMLVLKTNDCPDDSESY